MSPLAKLVVETVPTSTASPIPAATRRPGALTRIAPQDPRFSPILVHDTLIPKIVEESRLLCAGVCLTCEDVCVRTPRRRHATVASLESSFDETAPTRPRSSITIKKLSCALCRF